MKPIVGLTGGIASGKSTVAEMFRELGIPVIDADLLAREVVEPGTPGLAALIQEFGPSILDNNSALDRAALGKIVFNDPAARERLNAITHPLIAQASQAQIADLQVQSAPFIIYEAALLVENRAHLAFAALIVVDTSEELQLARSMQRDRSTKEEALARIRAQIEREERLAVAHY